MNKKITVQRQDGKVVSCVISPHLKSGSQLNQVMGFSEGDSFFVDFDEKVIRIVSSVDWQEWGRLSVISVEDTEEAVDLQWKNVE